MSLLGSLLQTPTELLASIPIVVGLLINAAQLRHVQKAQQVSNQLTVVENHRNIWTLLFTHPQLERILEQDVDLTKKPISNQESLFITFLLLHLKAVLRAQKEDMFIAAKHLDRDIAWIFSLPIPREVWNRSKSFQDPELVALVEAALSNSGTKPRSSAEASTASAQHK